MKFDTHIVGIPCQIEINYAEKGFDGRRGHPDNWLPDEDPFISYDILDRNGRPAPWLQRKMKTEDFEKVTEEAIKHLEREAADAY